MRRKTIKCSEQKEVSVGDSVVERSLSNGFLTVTKVYPDSVDAVYNGVYGKLVNFYKIKKNRLVFGDLEREKKLKSLNDRRWTLYDMQREIDKAIKDIEESFVGCE